jgi:SAM-dependent methyltransferase
MTDKRDVPGEAQPKRFSQTAGLTTFWRAGPHEERDEARPVRPDYGNWVPWKLIYVPGALAAGFLVLTLLHPAFLIGACLFLACLVYFSYARHQFSPAGKNLEERIRGQVLDHLDWHGEGTTLDIGCGNGPLTTGLAKKCPRAQVLGLDSWNGVWDYSRQTCDTNAALEGVADRVTFQSGSAVCLPFEDESFDAVISNLVFHSVRDARDKTQLVKEALRVVKKGGKFCFQDLMVGRGKYGKPDQLLQEVRGWGVQKADYIDTSESVHIPRALRNPVMVGNIGITHGTK